MQQNNFFEKSGAKPIKIKEKSALDYLVETKEGRELLERLLNKHPEVLEEIQAEALRTNPDDSGNTSKP